jgi:hypothetical protein
MKYVYRSIAAAAGVALISLAFGCGSSGNDATSAPLTKAQFIRKAEAACTKVNKEEEAAAAAWEKEYAGGTVEAEEHADDGMRRVVAPSLRHKAEELEALVPPTSDKVTIDQMIQNLSRASKQLAKGGFKALSDSGALEFKREAITYGLKSCGSML